MEFAMNAVFHYAKDSEKYIRHFQEKRLDYAARDLYHYSAEQLRALLASFKAKAHWNRTKQFAIIPAEKTVSGRTPVRPGLSKRRSNG